MSTEKHCPACRSQDIYFDGTLWNCPACFHEWNTQKPDSENQNDKTGIIDAHGNELQDGDTVTVIKDLKVKGASASIKVGTKIKNISLHPGGADGHNIQCKVPGFGSMHIKSEFVKKA
ncbi:MAG: alkylphosphonate utilization protein [Deltaproteobacteria bacterium]|nr:alkylphosphonate utilization protein [Deltaproteobacteria bacterium]